MADYNCPKKSHHLRVLMLIVATCILFFASQTIMRNLFEIIRLSFFGLIVAYAIITFYNFQPASSSCSSNNHFSKKVTQNHSPKNLNFQPKSPSCSNTPISESLHQTLNSKKLKFQPKSSCCSNNSPLDTFTTTEPSCSWNSPDMYCNSPLILKSQPTPPAPISYGMKNPNEYPAPVFPEYRLFPSGGGPLDNPRNHHHPPPFPEFPSFNLKDSHLSCLRNNFPQNQPAPVFQGHNLFPQGRRAAVINPYGFNELPLKDFHFSSLACGFQGANEPKNEVKVRGVSPLNLLEKFEETVPIHW